MGHLEPEGAVEDPEPTELTAKGNRSSMGASLGVR